MAAVPGLQATQPLKWRLEILNMLALEIWNQHITKKSHSQMDLENLKHVGTENLESTLQQKMFPEVAHEKP